jgi:radical SAM superfamily enzyme YgiQ (UPF0313 family)
MPTYRVTPKTAALVDVLCFSAFWWEHIYLLADFLRRAGMLKGQKRPRVIVGGFETANPVPFACYADAVVVGDGEDIFQRVVQGHGHESVYTGTEPTVMWHDAEMRPFGMDTGGVARIEIARGCRHRCTFCAVAWRKHYRELPLAEIDLALRPLARRRVSLFAPSPLEHSAFAEIDSLCQRRLILRQDSDCRLDMIERLPTDRHKRSVPRAGLEGLSYRLRKLVGKNWSDDMVVENIKVLIQQGCGGLFLYVILDLPGEQSDDFDFFRTLAEKIGALPGAKGFVLKPSPSVFLPSPHTPLEMAPIHWERPYEAMWRNLFGRGGERRWAVTMAERTRIFGPAKRVLMMLATRAGSEFSAIEAELTGQKAIRVANGSVHVCDEGRLLDVLERHGGVERYCGVPQSAPWQVVQFRHKPQACP